MAYFPVKEFIFFRWGVGGGGGVEGTVTKSSEHNPWVYIISKDFFLVVVGGGGGVGMG